MSNNFADFLLLPFVELEIRFGTISNNFDSSVDKKYFSKLLESLNNCEIPWKTIESKDTIEYINDNKKLINDKTLMMKENVLKKNFSVNNSPFDIRLSINQEFSLNSYISSFSKNDSLIRKKQRTSFISDNYRYDLTIVNETKNNINVEKHEIEIELIVNKETLTWTNEYINDFIECKIYDIINIVEKTPRESFKLKFF